jgi:hypothetical protein
MRIRWAVLLTCLAVNVGCGDAHLPFDQGTATGNWQVNFVADGTGSQRTGGGFLGQVGPTITGAFVLAGACAGNGNVSGSIDRQDVETGRRAPVLAKEEPPAVRRPAEQLGPTAFLSTYTVGKGQLTFRTAASYFDLSESFGPITYFVESADSVIGGYGKLVGKRLILKSAPRVRRGRLPIVGLRRWQRRTVMAKHTKDGMRRAV